jgi:hypothetical protein
VNTTEREGSERGDGIGRKSSLKPPASPWFDRRPIFLNRANGFLQVHLQEAAGLAHRF